MADEAKPPIESPIKGEKMFSIKGIIVFVLVLMVWTGAMFMFLKGDKSKATGEEKHAGHDNLALFSRLIFEQSQIAPIKINEMVVQIKLDKNGDTSKLLSVSFAFHLGLTQKEQKAIDEGKWPPALETTRFAHEDITEAQYSNPLWSLTEQIVGKSEEGGGHGGGGGKGPNAHSYIAYVTNMEAELKDKILHTLMQVTYSQINTEDGKVQICEQLKNEANGMLKSLGKYPRVYKVSITQFFFQP